MDARRLSDERLGALLSELAIDVPPTPDIATAVAQRIRVEPQPRVPRIARWRPALVAAAVILLATFATLVFSPQARRAAADLLGVLGIRITTTSEDIPVPRATSTDLGVRTSLGVAEEQAGFDVTEPDLGMETSVFYDDSIGTTGMVSFLYPHDARDVSEADLLITQFRASVDEGYFKKVPSQGGRVRFVTVRGTTGYWVGGEPHAFYYVDSDGVPGQETFRLADDVLLWEENGITYRIEGAPSLGDALAIAESLR